MSAGILVAGIGNMFLGDDGFGVEVARRLAARPLPEGARVVDYGIRGMDLAYALLDEHEAVVFVDAAPRGGAPGTLYLLEPRLDEGGGPSLDTHGMDPVRVMALARAMGAKPTRMYVVGCEPAEVLDGAATEEVVAALSAPVEAAVDEAVRMVEELVGELADGRASASPQTDGPCPARARNGTGELAFDVIPREPKRP